MTALPFEARLRWRATMHEPGTSGSSTSCNVGDLGKLHSAFFPQLPSFTLFSIFFYFSVVPPLHGACDTSSCSRGSGSFSALCQIGAAASRKEDGGCAASGRARLLESEQVEGTLFTLLSLAPVLGDRHSMAAWPMMTTASGVYNMPSGLTVLSSETCAYLCWFFLEGLGTEEGVGKSWSAY